MNGYFDFADAAGLDAENFKGELLIVDFLVHRGEIAFELQQQAGQRVGIALDIVKNIVVECKDFAEIAQKHFAFENIGVVVDLGLAFNVVVVFVVDFADNFF